MAEPLLTEAKLLPPDNNRTAKLIFQLASLEKSQTIILIFMLLGGNTKASNECPTKSNIKTSLSPCMISEV
jgi:hypothetical protein